MNMLPVWTFAISLLGPFVKKAGEKVSEKMGEQLFTALEARFSKDKDKQGRKVLKDYRNDPEMYEGALAKHLERRSESDSFRAWLNDEVAKAQANNAKTPQRVVTQTVSVTDNSQTGDIVGEVGGDYVKGSKIDLKKK